MTGEDARTSDESLGAPGGGQTAGDEVAYLFMTVKAVRGREAAVKAKWQKQGWEFVSQSQGTLRSELNFRKPKPKGLGAYASQGYAAFRALNPRLQLGLLAGLAAFLLIGILAIVVGALSGGDRPTPIAAPATTSAAPPAQPSATPTTTVEVPSPTPTTASAEPSVTDITVDRLVDRLNSANMGGLEVGDQFRVIGELVGSEFWTTGASGDFFVTLKTKSGADLIVFVDESDADGWQDGTKVEMVLENVEVTFNGETTDGWFAAQSVRTISGGTT